MGGSYGGSFNETTGTSGVIGTATTNLSGTLTWSIVAGGDADISINSSTGAVSSARAIYSGDSAAFTVQVTNGTLTIGFPFTATGTVVSYETESTALFARFTTDPGATRKNHINTLINALKTAGVWTKLDVLYVLAAHDSQAALLNWVSSSYNLTLTNTPTFTTDQGYTGNGTNAALGSTFNPGSSAGRLYSRYSGHLGVYCRSTAFTTGYEIGVSASVNFLLSAGRSDFSNAMRGGVNDAWSNSTSSPANTKGHSCISRVSDTGVTYYKDGSVLSTVAIVTNGVPSASGTFTILRAATFYSPKQVSIAHMGGGLSDAEAAAMSAAFSTYLTAVGAI